MVRGHESLVSVPFVTGDDLRERNDNLTYNPTAVSYVD